MRKFTVKDFITYNNPCFSCNHKINFKIGFVDLERDGNISFIRPVVGPDYTEVELEIKYNHILKLYIFHKNNKIRFTSSEHLLKYLKNHKLFLISECSFCHTKIDSQFLNIHVQQEYIDAVGLSNERLVMADDENIYQIDSSFMEEKSHVFVQKITKTKLTSPYHLDATLLPLYKLKNKSNFIQKIKTFMIFS